MEGVIKWFNNERGSGFIVQEGWPDIFVHIRAIKTGGSHPLAVGERVRFDVQETRRRLKAVNVDRVDGSSRQAAGAA